MSEEEGTKRPLPLTMPPSPSSSSAHEIPLGDQSRVSASRDMWDAPHKLTNHKVTSLTHLEIRLHLSTAEFSPTAICFEILVRVFCQVKEIQRKSKVCVRKEIVSIKLNFYVITNNNIYKLIGIINHIRCEFSSKKNLLIA